MSETLHKVCKECRVKKNLSEFINSTTGKLNKTARCKICMKPQYKKYCKTFSRE